MGRERRRHLRISLKIPAQCVLDPEASVIEGALLDISEGGAYVTMNARVEVGADVTLRFRIPPDTVCEAWGRVLRYTPTPEGQGLGIGFVDANQGFRNWVRNLGAGLEIERPKFMRDMADLVVKVV